MGNPSPKPRAESSRQYERLLRGKATSKQYVQSLKNEARSRVKEQRAGKRGSASA
jgi:hypothetical protein